MEQRVDPPSFDYDALGGKYGWFVRADYEPEQNRFPFNRPNLRQVLRLLPFVLRYSLFWLRRVFHHNRHLFIDIFRFFRHDPHCALPCGGIGSGSIGRDFRGAFNKFNLKPGLVQKYSNPVKADQFLLTLTSSNGKLARQVVLSTVPSFDNSGQLSAWEFSLSPKDVTYRALYPRAWTKIELPKERVTILMRQISPVIPRDYKNSSLPSTVFTFTVINNSEHSLNVSITFTLRNLITQPQREKCHKSTTEEEECSSELFKQQQTVGAILHQHIHGMPCSFALGALPSSCSNSVSVTRSFDPSSDGSALWKQLMSTEGKLHEIVEEQSKPGSLGVAVSLHTKVEAGSKTEKEMAFCIAWHMPIVHFGRRRRTFRRWYSQFFDENQSKGAAELCAYSLTHYPHWESEIDAWQNDVLDNNSLPDWFKSALFNELYFLTAGGSTWLSFDPEWRQQELHLTDYSARQFSQYGRFAYLESWEYRMFNTYDVHFYACFALGQLFPELEHSMQSEFNDQIAVHSTKKIKYLMNGQWAPHKAQWRVPHDLGNPADEPWLRTNAYRIHHTGDWKDLNLKFVLCAFRTFRCVLNSDKQFLAQVWPQVRNMMEEALNHWDRNKDGMIENFGTADQTYDAWTMCGVSAYCGSLWLSALRATVAMAEEMNALDLVCHYRQILTMAKKVFECKLWNGRYWNFDEHSKIIMADQLCGYWFLHSIDPTLADDILPSAQVESALATIFRFNVCNFANGTLGAVNGMHENGQPGRKIQSDEVWVGTSYALASLFIQKGHFRRGFQIAEGPYLSCYHKFGLQFQTPEALYQHRFYRAIGYMRALAIWSIPTRAVCEKLSIDSIDEKQKEENMEESSNKQSR